MESVTLRGGKPGVVDLDPASPEVSLTMPVYEIDPQTDPRWAALIGAHPRASVFHTPEWLGALHRTYGYTPRAFTTAPPGSPSGSPLTGGIVFCQVRSWLTGQRLVSLPFSDHCDPLVEDREEIRTLLSEVEGRLGDRIRYVELRPRSAEPGEGRGYSASSGYAFHTLDLGAGAEALYAGLHKDSIRRKIRRAEREHVRLDAGRSEALLEAFYALLLRTRRRHRLAPQPVSWFRNLIDAFGDRLTIRVARANGRPIASILTLCHRQTVVYKYGCSDERFHSLGGMPFLFWSAIRQAASDGFGELDLGRSESGNAGLIRFKNRLGARSTALTYWRLNRSRPRSLPRSECPGRILARLPDSLFRLSGEIFYRHAG